MLGEVGQGSATFEDDLVKLNVQNSVTGEYSAEFRLVGDRLEGQLQVMGMAMQMSFSRG